MGKVLESLKRERQRYKDWLEDARNRIGENTNKLSRLYPVRERLGQLKEVAESREESFRGMIQGLDADSNWTGNKRDELRTLMGDSVTRDYKNYTEWLDQRLDAVCDEIARLENDSFSLGGDVTWLVRKVNTLTNEIRKWLN